ncbi:hypothetical protein [Kibdelosporangium philippinense]|uniref:hypothetical protein n=1 Tax=Kibdelosporangium philippinense TaxID=211113 RepID=UPI00361CC376
MNLSRAVVAVCGAAAVLTACTQPADPPKEVASLPTTGPNSSTAAPSSAPPSDESRRPQLRLDSSDEETQAAWATITSASSKTAM